VSHLKERKEKVCLNCQTVLIDRYCHVCGQENLEPKETVWHLVQHFFNDITHFDGKFFSTVKYLLRKPGYLSKEYMIGRRASYLNPIRMYVFSSAIFFLLLFSTKKPEDMVRVNDSPPGSGKTYTELQMQRTKVEKRMAGEDDEDDRKDDKQQVATLDMELAAIKQVYGDTTTRRFSKKDLGLLLARSVNDSLSKAGIPGIGKDGIPGIREAIAQSDKRREQPDEDESNLFGLHQGRYKTVEIYDSTERSLPDSLRDGWMKRTLTRKLVIAQEQFYADKKKYIERFGENMLHSIPKILFVSLPFFALILNILYFRRKKTYYYVSHGIFTIHVYCATFILSMAIILLNKLYDGVSMGWLHFIIGLLIFLIVLYLMIYLYKAMRGFYGQGRAKTMVKYLLTCLLALIINSILFVLFLLFSAISI